MTSEVPKISKTGRYSVMQACAALGIDRKTLSSYVTRGLIKAHIRKVNARKFFIGDDLLRLWYMSF